MSFNLALVPDRDSLPLKKRDQRPSSPLQEQQQQQQCVAATFKAPYPYKSHSEIKTKHTGPFQPVPRRVPALYQPWTQTHPSTRSKPHMLSAFREHHGWAEWREFNPLHPGWDFPHHYQHHFSDTPALYPGHPHHYSRFNPIPLVPEGFHRVGGEYGWEQLKTLKDRSLNAERWSDGKTKGPHERRRNRKVEYFPRVGKELVDVYVEYPFFVRGQGWSSCNPQRTARLCGLQCRQLSVGDVCLALTPISAPQPPSSATPEPKSSLWKSRGGHESLEVPHPQPPAGPQWPALEQKREATAVRRRHYSAPELRHPGINCMQ
uniref:uncharacterized protein LOC109955967 isoform X2 n=1 Tax=Monopterus albus TaxID=43700 RepID=UPI0009B2FFFD|nr:uncharacterized protein LOC109955967 isoform X2 [Monopterus albus]